MNDLYRLSSSVSTQERKRCLREERLSEEVTQFSRSASEAGTATEIAELFVVIAQHSLSIQRRVAQALPRSHESLGRAVDHSANESKIVVLRRNTVDPDDETRIFQMQLIEAKLQLAQGQQGVIDDGHKLSCRYSVRECRYKWTLRATDVQQDSSLQAKPLTKVFLHPPQSVAT